MLFHKHRILPGHMGGTYDSKNVIRVNVALHAFLHQQLFLEHGRWQDWLAWHALSGQISQADVIREAARLANTGRVAPNKGKPMSSEQKQKISASQTGRKVSVSTKRKMSLALMGNHNNQGHTNNAGHRWTDEMKHQAAVRGNGQQGKIRGPYRSAISGE
jgi:hypothetical protein